MLIGLVSPVTMYVLYIGVIVWQASDEPAYDLAVARSYEQDFWAWLGETGTEFGLDAG